MVPGDMGQRLFQLLRLCALPVFLYACANTDTSTTAPPEPDGAAVDAGQDAGSAPDVVTVDAPAPADVPVLGPPANVDTSTADTVRAGDAVAVVCVLRDQRGNEVPTPAGV